MGRYNPRTVLTYLLAFKKHCGAIISFITVTGN